MMVYTTKDDGHSIYILVLGILDMYIENVIRTVVTWKKCKIIPDLKVYVHRSPQKIYRERFKQIKKTVFSTHTFNQGA